MIEAIYIFILFIIYSILWKIKKNSLIKETGIDPEVMVKSKSNVQKYMSFLTKLITVYVVLIIVVNFFSINLFSVFVQTPLLDKNIFNTVGFIIGILGLCLCLYSQIIMGKEWRVGIDEKVKTDLVLTGIYKIIRNPTYLGLFLLNLGVWIILPTWPVFIFNLIFILFLEIQVRCEEDFLEKEHGEKYIEYKNKTWRYFPHLY